ncbi:MAG: homocysteine S-methyltransferase [Dermatophilaceae bacterium]|nr:homocysteine S-methyltransferase [Dermatophilaceae bacterium]
MTGMSARWDDLFGAGPVVVDGGLSTQLSRSGHDVSGQLWTGRVLLERPDAITEAHAAFAAAGADVLITASYQVSRTGFAAAGRTAADADDALRASVVAARTAAVAAGRPVRVAASVGPYGAVLHDGSEYRGQYGLTARQLEDFHRERIEVLLEAGPDLLAVETIPDLDEAAAILAVLRDLDVPAWLTFSASDGERLNAGQRIEEATAVVEASDVVMAVGINCTDPAHLPELLTRMATTTGLPLVVYPNAGGQWDPADGEWHGGAVIDGSAAFSADEIQRWRAAGARAIGGCCGTDAATIRRVAQALAAPAM